jgi:pilus assembly protein FimV
VRARPAAGRGGRLAGEPSGRAEGEVARQAALREASSRIAELEKNVDDLQKLLELKNRSMADLQKQLDGRPRVIETVTGRSVQ